QASKNLQGGKKFWLHLASENFLPNFCEQLIGQKSGETRLVIVQLPDDFPVKELAGKKADYAVTVREIKEKILPPVDDALAANRLKPNFILHRIAEREKIQVTKDDVDLRIRQEAGRYDISPDKMRKELQHKDALDDVAEQILLGKTLDFLKANVSVQPAEESTVKEEKA